MAGTNLSTFNYLSNTVRVVEIDGQPWFVAADVCRTLELDLTYGTSTHLKKLDTDEKRPVPRDIISGKGMNQATLVSEPGLYKLIGRSTKPEAKAFDRWARHEVLPAIRKDGMYVAGEENVKTSEMPDFSVADGKFPAPRNQQEIWRG